MKATAGPWKVENSRLRDGSRVIVHRNDDGKDIHVAYAADFNRYDRDEEVDANARLIAQAPAFAAFAERVAQSTFAETRDKRPDCLDAEMIALVDEARSILRSVRGEED